MDQPIHVPLQRDRETAYGEPMSRMRRHNVVIAIAGDLVDDRVGSLGTRLIEVLSRVRAAVRPDRTEV